MPSCLPDGRQGLVKTLRRPGPAAQRSAARHAQGAADYITRLPKAEHESPEWQAAMEALIMAAEGRGPLMHARVGMLRALNRHVEREFNPDRKDHHWGKRKLARDR